MMWHSRIVDKLKRHQTLYFFLGLYIVLSLIFAAFLAHPVYGLLNTKTSCYRLLGWSFDVFMDLYPGLIVSTFWGFVNSLSTPHFASHGYGTIVAISRIGGISMPLLSLVLIEQCNLHCSVSIPYLIIISSLFLLASMLCIRRITQVVPSTYLHGYTDQTVTKKKKSRPGILEGLRLMISEPYVFGIFALVCSFEAINVVFDYQMNMLVSLEKNNDVQAMSAFMLIYTSTFHTLSLFFALIGTRTLLKKIGIQRSLMIMPLTIIGLVVLLIMHPHLSTIFFIMVVLRGLNYGFNHPIREMLYVPTVSNIQFKSKAWIESFGRTFSKNSGNMVNLATKGLQPYYSLLLQSSFTLTISIMWLGVAFAVGQRYLDAIKKGTIIGSSD
jgi:AAA family ATP:ADP antiporter